jgi:hypothetical protein
MGFFSVCRTTQYRSVSLMRRSICKSEGRKRRKRRMKGQLRPCTIVLRVRVRILKREKRTRLLLRRVAGVEVELETNRGKPDGNCFVDTEGTAVRFELCQYSKWSAGKV